MILTGQRLHVGIRELLGVVQDAAIQLHAAISIEGPDAERRSATNRPGRYGEITIEKGRVKEKNFNDYRMLRMSEMPEIRVHIVRNHEEPGGVGEPAVPPIAPAVANALFALTGKRVRKLPIRAEMLSIGNGS